jgi:hypothetical protein
MSSPDMSNGQLARPLPLRRSQSGVNQSGCCWRRPAWDVPPLAECRLVYLDAPSGRLIVTSSAASEPLAAAIDAPLLALVVRPGEGVFARPCLVEAHPVAARCLVLCATAP